MYGVTSAARILAHQGEPMIQGMIGRKLGMTQVFDESGVVHPATVSSVAPTW